MCLKVVHEDTAQVLEADAGAIRAAGGVAAWINPTMSGVADVLAGALLQEGDMRREREFAAKVRRALGADAYAPLRVATPREVPALCGDGCFAYEFVHGQPLRAPVEHDVARRIVVLFFTLLHKDGILLGDPHRDNFLLGADGTLTVLDFGCAVKLHRGARYRCAEMHLARGDPELLARAMPEATEGVLEAVRAISAALWEEQELPSSEQLCASMRTPALVTMEVDREMVLVTRAMAMLSSTAEALGVRRVRARKELEAIDPYIT